MNYFVTGATGFVGGILVERLAAKPEVSTIYCLVREGSENKLETLKARCGAGAAKVVGIKGDLTKAKLGVGKGDLTKLKGKVQHFFHLAAVYDMTSKDEEGQMIANVNGTRNAVQLAEAIEAGAFQHTSSIAAAGLFNGYWREDMFEEAENYSQPYFKSKHDSEGVVRYECKIPWRVYRPGIVVGSSQSGYIDKIDGPYYFFKLLQKLRNIIPAWCPLPGVEGSRINVVPVDFVVDAMLHLAHKPGLDGRAFHLVDPEPYRAGEVINIFADAAHAPKFSMRIDIRMFNIIPKTIRDAVGSLPPVKRIIDQILGSFSIPKAVLSYLNYPTRFDCRDALKELEGSGIKCPRLEDYAPKIWDYWERNLDPDLFKDRTLAGAVRNRVVMITGASSGIGRASAIKVAKAGGKVLLVARSADKLEEAAAEIRSFGGVAEIRVCDVSSTSDIERMCAEVLRDHGKVDILVNNAGRSIRRSLQLSYDRFHDFERTMQLNYFGAIKLIMCLVPSMKNQRRGQIINISSIGTLAFPPRFSAYIASKSALDAFSRCVQPEFLDSNIQFTTIHMPLVRTPMISATTIYNHVPTLTPDEAADMICDAMIHRPTRVATRLGIMGAVLNQLMPKIADIVQNTSYKLFGDSSAAKGDKGEEAPPSPEAIAFATIMRGVHW